MAEREAKGAPAPAGRAEIANAATDRIAAKCREFEERFRNGEIASLVRGFYHADAVMEGRDLPPQVGRDAIARIFLEAREACGSIEIDLEPVTVAGTVAFGNITNRNTLMDGSVDIHRVLMVWQQVGDDWFVVRDFFFAERELELRDIDFEVLADFGGGARARGRAQGAN